MYQSLYLQRCKFLPKKEIVLRIYKYIFTRKLQVDKILNEKSVSLVCSVHHYKTGEDAHRPFDF